MTPLHRLPTGNSFPAVEYLSGTKPVIKIIVILCSITGASNGLLLCSLAAKDANGTHVQLSQSDLKKFRLIDYNTSKLIGFNNSFTGEWTRSRLHQGYTWDRGFLDSIRVLHLTQTALFEAVEQRAHVAGGWKLNYLSRSNTKLKMRVLYNFPNFPNDNQDDRKSDGSGYLRDTLVSEMTRNGIKYRAYEQHLNIRMSTGRKVPIKSVIHPIGPDTVKGADVIWACRGNVSATRTAHTYMCYPAQTHIRMGQPPNFYGWLGYYYYATDLLTMAFEAYAPRIVHAREGEVVIGHFLMS